METQSVYQPHQPPMPILQEVPSPPKQPLKAPVDLSIAGFDLFQVTLANHLENLHASLTAEHEKAIAMLQLENEKLREELVALAGLEELKDGLPRQHKIVSLMEGHSPAGDATSFPDLKQVCTEGCKPDKEATDEPILCRADPHNSENPGQHLSYARRSSSAILQENRPRLQRLVHGKAFELASGALIMANIVLMACRMQYEGIEKGYLLQTGEFTKPASETWSGAEQLFFIFNIGFNVLFCIELLLRIASDRLQSIYSGWIWFDGIIVGMSLIDLFGSLPLNPVMMRLIRLVRLMRLLKILRTMEVFHSLLLLLKAIAASWHAALWSFLLLLSIQLLAGLFLCQALADFISDESQDLQSRRDMYEYFGTFIRTQFTMFEITMANWVPCARDVFDHVGEFWALVIIVYRCLFCSAVVKVITALFITETYRVLADDDDLAKMKDQREKRVFARKARKIMAMIGRWHTGTLQKKHVDALLDDEEVADHITPLGFETQDLRTLFWLLENGTNEVELGHFLARMGKFKGAASKLEIAANMKLLHNLHQDIRKTCMEIGQSMPVQGLRTPPEAMV